MKAFLLGTLLIIVGCSSSSSQESGNLGYKYTIVCRNEVQDCYNRATEFCPDGYLVTNQVRARRLDEANSEYSVIVRCKHKMISP